MQKPRRCFPGVSQRCVMLAITFAVLFLFGNRSLAEEAAEPLDELGPPELPGVTYDIDSGWVEVEAQVAQMVLPSGEIKVNWLELLLCPEGGREHETLLTTQAKPSHVHLALILLGLDQGTPQRGETIDPEDPSQGTRIIPATGPLVKVELHWHDGETAQVTNPYDWLLVQGEPIEREALWQFTGSRFVEADGRKFYLGDLNGTLLSLVHFGDDVLAAQTDLTQSTDMQQLQPHLEVMPEAGTPVVVRLIPVAEEPDETEEQKTDEVDSP